MMPNFLIGLREGLEAALVVGLLVAYLGRVGRRDVLGALWTGVACGIALSVGFGALLTYGPRGLSFEAQETVGGLLSILAVGLVTWMIVWMASAARTLRSDLEGRLGHAAELGPVAVGAVGLLAVGREGLETALFVWAAVRAAGGTAVPLAGALLGLASAALLGVLVTRGAVRLDLARFFTWSAFALVLVAAGVLSYGVHDLQEAGVLPGLHRVAFDVSEQVPPGSWYGTLLKGSLNFSPVTTWLEAAAWSTYLLVVVPIVVRRLGAPRPASPSSDSTRHSTEKAPA